jgi:hypothetical protein
MSQPATPPPPPGGAAVSYDKLQALGRSFFKPPVALSTGVSGVAPRGDDASGFSAADGGGASRVAPQPAVPALPALPAVPALPTLLPVVIPPLVSRPASEAGLGVAVGRPAGGTARSGAPPRGSPSKPLHDTSAPVAVDPECDSLRYQYEACMQDAAESPAMFGRGFMVPCVDLYERVISRCGTTLPS